MIGNFTVSEYVKMGNTLSEDQVFSLIESYEKKILDLKEVNSVQYKDNELVEEQLYFAKEVIYTILKEMNDIKSVTKLKKLINNTIEQSYLDL